MDNFNAKKVCDKIVKEIKEYFDRFCPNGKAIIGISGGKDSTITAMLCVLALGKDRVHGCLMPNGSQKDINDAMTVVQILGIEHDIRNIDEMFKDEIRYMNNFKITDDFKSVFTDLPSNVTDNVPPRLRMMHLYAIAAFYGGLVMNTCNLSEDWVGYFTKYGDSAGDFAPLFNLTVTEVIQVGLYAAHVLFADCSYCYEQICSLCRKTPADGLCGKTDEDNLGFTYNTLDRYLRLGECPPDNIKEIIDRKHFANLHKIRPIEGVHFGEIAANVKQ